ncbi:MAG TPA: glycerophosphodiester phosphodiesterase [Gaiellaceae bacterium]|nr:glycerophosphodiester phosphodiesterase [Gaiellaceae bacterium]
MSLELRRPAGRPLVIGHRGARLLAPENTFASFEAAVAAGVDLVELDVAPGLLVAHDEADAGAPSLDDVLAYLAAAGVGAHVDLKQPGYEPEAVAAIRSHGLGERALVSTAFAASARTVRRIAPDLPVAIGYPRDRYGVSRLGWPAPLSRAGAAALRQAVPARVPLLLRASRATVLALHHTLCSPRAVAAAHRLGAPVLGWTANDEETVRRLVAAGVDGLVSDDPRVVRSTLATLPAA